MKATFKFEDVFSVTGRGVVITGRIVEGNIDKTCLILMGDKRLSISGIEMFRKLMDGAGPGDNVGLLLGNQAPIDYIKSYRGNELTISNISEIREEKLNNLL
jgi:translation elongation factor EF-Tu-like GTPase